ncbi:MAG TPA: GAF domain-containing sensor histidine kinase [Acidimicrobiales bacterium]|nr:GAF domain-containing sensor histidine kinase [Acidimicrobiales bacterium]
MTPAPTRTWRESLGWRDLQPASPELVVRMAPMLSVLRWATLCLALALAVVAQRGASAAVGGAVLVAYTLGRTIWPIGREEGRWQTIGALLLEVAVGVAVVETTGFDHSPFLICLGVSTVIAGFAGGLRVMSGLAAIAGLAVALPSLFLASGGVAANASVQFGVELVLVGVVGGFSRYLVEDAHQAREGLSDRVEHLAEVNELLLDLHRATEREVTPMHVEGAARWALERLEEMFDPDVAAVVLLDPATGSWHVAAATGVRTGTPERPVELLPALRLAAEGHEPLTRDDLEQGLSYRSRWGLYCPMRARGEVVGVLAVESKAGRGSDPRDRRRLSDLAKAAALAIDNARWLERIHTLGMEQERSRLARELHDHIGQSVVYIGFELDRLVQLNHGRAVQGDLMALRGDLRDLVEEMRDMLVDLRSDVSETQGVDGVLRSFLDRVNKRNRVEVSLVAEADSRMPLPVEREVWRVAREAVMNAERHAHASHVSILWLCNHDGALLEVADDGVGIPAGKVAGSSGYGLIGMRERADSIGAQLEITSGPGTGTLVRMRVRAA